MNRDNSRLIDVQHQHEQSKTQLMTRGPELVSQSQTSQPITSMRQANMMKSQNGFQYNTINHDLGRSELQNRSTLSPQLQSIDFVADQKVGPDRWISRTGHIGEELRSPMEKRIKNQKSVVTHAQEMPLLQPSMSEALKHILHQGYWRFKSPHYKESLKIKNLQGIKKNISFKSPREGFDTDIVKALAITE